MKLSRYPNVNYTLLTEALRPRRRFLIVLFRLLAVTSLVGVLSVTTFYLYQIRSGRRFEPATLNAKPGEASLGLVRGPKIAVPEIPLSFKTVGLIFYGRRSRVEILDCYLKVRPSELAIDGFSKPDLRSIAKPSRKWWVSRRSALCRENNECRRSRMARSASQYFRQLQKV